MSEPTGFGLKETAGCSCWTFRCRGGECLYTLMPLSIQWYRNNSNRIWQGSRYSLRSENRLQPRDHTCGMGFLGTGLSRTSQLNSGLNSSSLGGLGCSHSETKIHLNIGMIPASRSLSQDHGGPSAYLHRRPSNSKSLPTTSCVSLMVFWTPSNSLRLLPVH